MVPKTEVYLNSHPQIMIALVLFFTSLKASRTAFVEFVYTASQQNQACMSIFLMGLHQIQVSLRIKKHPNGP
jgi:hypothetical protein